MPRRPPDPDPIPEPCRRCGRVHYRGNRLTCTAHRSNGMPCLKYPAVGGHVCGLHGGAARQVKAAATRRKEERDLQRRLTAELTSAGMDLPYVDPIQTLLWLVSMTAQSVKWLAFRVAELNVPDPANQGEFADLHGIDDDGNPIQLPDWARLYGPDHNGDLATHPLWKEWKAAIDQHARIAKMAVDAGVSERMVRIAEIQGETIARVMTETLAELGMPPNDRDRARIIIAAKFEEIAATTAPPGEVVSRTG